jgi:mono/diheme cytochrome c family protein
VRAASPVERAALGYLHGNCSSCHNARGPLADLGLSFAVAADGTPEALESAVGRAAHFRPAGSPPATRVAAGDPAGSLLLRRVGSRDPLLQMPPFGTRAVDADAVALLTEWILAGPGRSWPAHSQSILVAAEAATFPKEKQP